MPSPADVVYSFTTCGCGCCKIPDDWGPKAGQKIPCSRGCFAPSAPPCLDGTCDDGPCILCNKGMGRSGEDGCCVRACDQNACCEKIGSCGIHLCAGEECYQKRVEPYRGFCFLAATIISTLEMIIVIWATSGTTTNTDVLKYTYWSSSSAKIKTDGQDVVEFDVYIGVQKLVFEMDGEETGRDWDDTCLFEKEELCKDCKDAATGLMTSAITAVLSKLGQLGTDVQRSVPMGDLNCQKAFGVATGIVLTAMSLNSWLVYRDKCYSAFDGTTQTMLHPDGGSIEAEFTAAYGPGIVIMILMTIAAFPDGILHACFKVPPKYSKQLTPYDFNNGERKKLHKQWVLEEIDMDDAFKEVDGTVETGTPLTGGHQYTTGV